MSECERIRRTLRELEHYLTHIKWDLEETEFAMKIDRLHGIERPSVKMHYEWLKRKKEEVEREIEELKKKLATCILGLGLFSGVGGRWISIDSSPTLSPPRGS